MSVPSDDEIEIRINVYDLLPPGRLSTFLWTIGNGLLHSGVVISGREYAFGGHDQRGVSGVYWTTPRQEPPGGTFRCEILHGSTRKSAHEIDQILLDTCHAFPGPAWNLLSNNCNHFTSQLCMRFTGRPAPAWLNRAARVGVALPCIVPRELLAAPDVETAEGELVERDEFDEQAAMLGRGEAGQYDYDLDDDYDGTHGDAHDTHDHGDEHDGENQNGRNGEQTEYKNSFISYTDSDGRPVPVSERAPVPR